MIKIATNKQKHLCQSAAKLKYCECQIITFQPVIRAACCWSYDKIQQIFV